ncbi:MAG: hypothetical protein JJU02_06040 [Cryomorphaceae bacterium]|nr:hypothetical protein [Cryomorphaceae bacterium]
MKKNSIIILSLIAILLGGLIYYTNLNKTADGRKVYDYNFHIEDTASVARIVIKDKSPKEVNLVRTDRGWTIDGDHLTRKRAINVILKTLHDMRLKNFVGEKMKPTVLNRLATYGIEVQVYDKNDDILQHFFVGPPTMDEMGSYMMKKGGDAPYAVFIPGFNGNLTTRFFADPIMWRDRTIWGYDNLEIKKARVRYLNQPANSFELVKHTEGEYELTRLIDGEIFTPDSIKSGLFFSTFTTLQYEGAIVPSDGIWARQDSLKKSPPVFDIYVEKENGDWKMITAYRIKAEEGVIDEDGNPLDYDLDRVHAFITTSDGDEIMVLAQYYGLQLALVDIATLISTF